jgi:SAM-dependent methyltransferase
VKFPESALAHRYLDGLVGVEIGGAAHNPFGLSTWNVDQLSHLDPRAEIYASEQRRQCGEVLPVDVVAAGDRLPIRDGGIDFVVSSHVIEHFFDPVGALAEWARAARCYVLIICPQRDALGSDRALPLTPLAEIRERTGRHPPNGTPPDKHHSRWTLATFCEMCEQHGFRLVATEDPDTKVGNGFTVVIDVSDPPGETRARQPRRRRLDVRRAIPRRWRDEP